MPFNPNIQRTPKAYIRAELDSTAIAPTENTRAVNLRRKQVNSKKRFNRMETEVKKAMVVESKEYVDLSESPILIQRLAYLFVSGCYSLRQTARIMKCSEATVKKTLKTPFALKIINEYQEEEKQEIDMSLKALRAKALDKYNELLDDDNSLVKFNVAKDIFDRTGHKPKDDKNVTVSITYEEKLKNLMNGTDFIDYTVVEDTDTDIDSNAIDSEEEQITIEGAIQSD